MGNDVPKDPQAGHKMEGRQGRRSLRNMREGQTGEDLVGGCCSFSILYAKAFSVRVTVLVTFQVSTPFTTEPAFDLHILTIRSSVHAIKLQRASTTIHLASIIHIQLWQFTFMTSDPLLYT